MCTLSSAEGSLGRKPTPFASKSRRRAAVLISRLSSLLPSVYLHSRLGPVLCGCSLSSDFWLLQCFTVTTCAARGMVLCNQCGKDSVASKNCLHGKVDLLRVISKSYGK